MNWLERKKVSLRAVWNSDLYHGRNRRRRFFEGWYFKLVSADESTRLAVIPGISMDAEGRSKAFIQVLDGVNASSRQYDFPASDFIADPVHFDVRIAGNRFTREYLTLALPEVRGRLSMDHPVPWPSSLLSPGVMGWYSFVPFMECYHGIVSMDHGLKGALEVDGREVDFTGGRGYAEKDWGTSFPRCWIWGQSNHFRDSSGASSPGTSVMFSIAHIPWRGSYFVGFLGGCLHQGKLYRFTTYNRTKARLEERESGVSLEFRSPTAELLIEARQAEGADLRSPIEGAMLGKVNESIQAKFEMVLLEGGHKLFTGVGTSAGMELAGDTSVLFRDLG